MSNITVRKGDAGQITAPAREWDPLRMMRDLVRWDPFREMAPVWAVEDRYVDAFAPAFEVKETKEGYVFKADVPGIKEQDLEITLTGNRLAVSGKREAEQQEQTDTFYAYERSYGAFTRAFTLPEGADTEHIRAEMKDGVLNLVLPKLPEMQPRKIAVKADKPKS